MQIPYSFLKFCEIHEPILSTLWSTVSYLAISLLYTRSYFTLFHYKKCQFLSITLWIADGGCFLKVHKSALFYCFLALLSMVCWQCSVYLFPYFLRISYWCVDYNSETDIRLDYQHFHLKQEVMRSMVQLRVDLLYFCAHHQQQNKFSLIIEDNCYSSTASSYRSIKA